MITLVQCVSSPWPMPGHDASLTFAASPGVHAARYYCGHESQTIDDVVYSPIAILEPGVFFCGNEKPPNVPEKLATYNTSGALLGMDEISSLVQCPPLFFFCIIIS